MIRMGYRSWPAALLLAGLASTAGSLQAAVEIKAEDIPLNKTVVLRAPAMPLVKSQVHKFLARWFREDYDPYVSVYRFKVVPKARFTIYEYHPADGIDRWVFLFGQSPFTDETRAQGSSFATRGQQPTPLTAAERERGLRFDAFRTNFTIDPASEEGFVYIVATCNRADAANTIMIKNPADSDEEVNAPSEQLGRPGQKRTWGRVASPLLVVNIDRDKIRGR